MGLSHQPRLEEDEDFQEHHRPKRQTAGAETVVTPPSLPEKAVGMSPGARWAMFAMAAFCVAALGISVGVLTRGQTTLAAESPATPLAPIAAASLKSIIPVVGNDSLSCAVFKTRMDELVRLSQVGTIDATSVAIMTDSLSSARQQAASCADKAALVNQIISDQIVVKELYTQGPQGQMIERSPQELRVRSQQNSRPSR